MKKYVFMVLVGLLGLSSCSSDSDDNNGGGAKDLVFTATMENNGQKVVLDGMTPSWEVGDQIQINSIYFTAQTAGTSTTFTTNSSMPLYAPYKATSNGIGIWSGTMGNRPLQNGVISWEENLTYVEGKFNMPMYAESNDTHLQFYNLCGVLKITVGSEWVSRVKSIRLSANKAIAGHFTISNHAAAIGNTTYFNYHTINYQESVSLAEGPKVFYMPLPPNTYRNIKIELSEDGETFPTSMTTKSGVDITVERNTIYPIDYQDNIPPTGTAKATINENQVDVTWVQLWKNGPKWAKYNVGVTDGKEETYGGYYAMSTYNHDDVATTEWGNNWRMPTQQELWGLINNCSYETTTLNGVFGMRFTGKGDYSGYSIFLPAAGQNASQGIPGIGSELHYWSNTSVGVNKVNYYALSYRSPSLTVENPVWTVPKSVRAVLK